MRRLNQLLKLLETERAAIAASLTKPFKDLSDQNFKAGQHAALDVWSQRIAEALSRPDEDEEETDSRSTLPNL